MKRSSDLNTYLVLVADAVAAVGDADHLGAEGGGDKLGGVLFAVGLFLGRVGWWVDGTAKREKPWVGGWMKPCTWRWIKAATAAR